MNDTLRKEQRERYLRNLIKEGILTTLVEQDLEQQSQQSSPVPPATPGPNPNTNTTDPAIQNPQQTNQPNMSFSVDEMVNKLNVLRGAKSFKDPEIFGQFTTFFNKLTDEQKTSFDYMLSELGKIVVTAQEAQAGIQHSSVPSPSQKPVGAANVPPAAPYPQPGPQAPLSPSR